MKLSRSGYTSPVFLVQHLDDKIRIAIDYCRLQENVVTEAVPLPNIQQHFNLFIGAQYFTLFDINSAYLLIPLFAIS